MMLPSTSLLRWFPDPSRLTLFVSKFHRPSLLLRRGKLSNNSKHTLEKPGETSAKGKRWSQFQYEGYTSFSRYMDYWPRFHFWRLECSDIWVPKFIWKLLPRNQPASLWRDILTLGPRVHWLGALELSSTASPPPTQNSQGDSLLAHLRIHSMAKWISRFRTASVKGEHWLRTTVYLKSARVFEKQLVALKDWMKKTWEGIDDDILIYFGCSTCSKSSRKGMHFAHLELDLHQVITQ